jgi:ATP-dependent DNA helicase RecG
MTTPDDDLRQRVSFKKQTTPATESAVTLAADSSVAAIARMLVALANSSGGTLMIGAETADQPPAQVIDRLVKAALALEPPLIMPLPAVRTEPDTSGTDTTDDKTVIVARVPAGMPHVYSYNGQYLYRHEERNLPLAAQHLRRLLLQRGELTFETQPVPGASPDSIDWQKARAYAHSLTGSSATQAGSQSPNAPDADTRRILLQRGCLVQQTDRLRPTWAGLLLFGHDPQRYLINSDITAARFAGDTMSDTFQREDIGGTLPQQIKRAETFLIDHLRKAVTLKETMQRDEQYEYPMEAARELLINAVAHRDYSLRGDNIRLFLFSDRFEVHSPGHLPGPMTLENLQDERFSRNPVIVQVLSDMHFIEKLGYGLNRVMHLMQTHQLPEPVFQERSGSFQVTLYRTALRPLGASEGADKPSESPDAASDTAAADSATDATTGTPEPATQPVSQPADTSAVVVGGLFRGHEVNQRQEEALDYLHRPGNTRITNSDLKERFPDVHPETIRRDLVDLVAKDILKKMGQKRGSYYVLQPEPDTSQAASSDDD